MKRTNGLRLLVQGALERILMQQDVPGAVAFVEGEVSRLLSGKVEMWELAMTGGLWRVTGQQLEKAAAAAGRSSIAQHRSVLVSLCTRGHQLRCLLMM
jgi:hypothetical protein